VCTGRVLEQALRPGGGALRPDALRLMRTAQAPTFR
jgi:hypothetical protein